MFYSKIQSVLYCIHCWLSFDWAMPECTFGLENLLHNAVFPVASWKLGLPLSFSFCELHAAGELSLNQKSVMTTAFVLFVLAFLYLFQVHKLNPATHGFHLYGYQSLFLHFLPGCTQARSKNIFLPSGPCVKVWQISALYFTVRYFFFLPSVEKV